MAATLAFKNGKHLIFNYILAMAEIQQLLALRLNWSIFREKGYKKAKPAFPITSTEGLAKLEWRMESYDDFKNAVVTWSCQ